MGTSIGAVQGADITAYTVEKGAIYQQTSAAAPAPLGGSPYLFRASAEGAIHDAVFDATVRMPLGGDIILQMNENGTALELLMPLPDLTTLNTVAPNGNYTFLFDTENDGVSVAQLTLSGTVFPTAIPTISNFAATQEVDPSADFTLTFNAFGNVEGTERWELSILDEFGFEIYSDAGMGGSVTLPQGALFEDATHEARLRFVKEVARDTSSYPGALGSIEIYNETRFELVTGMDGGGGGDDTTPPMLFFTNPASGAEDVIVNTQVTFIFNEAMTPTQSIEWSSNVNSANFNYTWMQDGQVLVATYNGVLPGNATITWKLNPTAGNPLNFRDVAGNELAVGQFQGSFTTAEGGDPNDPCNGGGDDGRGGGSIFKALNFVQTGNNAPVPDTEMAATFSAFYNAGTNQVVSGVTVEGPAGTESLANLFGNFILSEEFSGGAALEAAFPAGNYTTTVSGTGGGSATLAVGSTAQVPIPQVLNLTALEGMNVANEFTLNFAAFTGAGANDGIFIAITSEDGETEFYAPDYCVPRELPNTATSVVIPANTFEAGQTYRGSISFSRMSENSSTIPNTTIVAGVSARTSFEFTIGGGSTPNQPMWLDVVRNANGTLTWTIQGDTGITLRIEGSDSPASGWTEVSTEVLATGSHQVTLDPKLTPVRFLRAVVL
jgi:hypothetical protein